jgi:hypothetical protein
MQKSTVVYILSFRKGFSGLSCTSKWVKHDMLASDTTRRIMHGRTGDCRLQE